MQKIERKLNSLWRRITLEHSVWTYLISTSIGYLLGRTLLDLLFTYKTKMKIIISNFAAAYQVEPLQGSMSLKLLYYNSTVSGKIHISETKEFMKQKAHISGLFNSKEKKIEFDFIIHGKLGQQHHYAFHGEYNDEHIFGFYDGSIANDIDHEPFDFIIDSVVNYRKQ